MSNHCLTPCIVVVRDRKCAVSSFSCVLTMPCGNFQDDVSVNLWFTRNIGKLRKPSKCYDKSFCLSENLSHIMYFIVCFLNLK